MGRPLRRTGQGRRNLHGWTGEEQAPFEAAQGGGGTAGQGHGRGHEGRPTNRTKAAIGPNRERCDAPDLHPQPRQGRRHRLHRNLPDYAHQPVNHNVGQYVRGRAHTQGIESRWSILKRGHTGTYHRMSWRHLNRYVSELTGRHNRRELDTLDQMTQLVLGMNGKRLRYADLTGRAA